MIVVTGFLRSTQNLASLYFRSLGSKAIYSKFILCHSDKCIAVGMNFRRQKLEMQIILKLPKHHFTFTIKLLRRAAPSFPIVFYVLKKVGLKSVYFKKFKFVEIGFSSLMIALRRKSESLIHIYCIVHGKLQRHRNSTLQLFYLFKTCISTTIDIIEDKNTRTAEQPTFDCYHKNQQNH